MEVASSHYAAPESPMPAARRKPAKATVPDLFGGELPTVRRSLAPPRDEVVGALDGMLAALKAAETSPWDPYKTELRRTYVVPELLRWLPEDEAATWRAALEAEFDRLAGRVAG
jgi:hypothetical protein